MCFVPGDLVLLAVAELWYQFNATRIEKEFCSSTLCLQQTMSRYSGLLIPRVLTVLSLKKRAGDPLKAPDRLASTPRMSQEMGVPVREVSVDRSLCRLDRRIVTVVNDGPRQESVPIVVEGLGRRCKQASYYAALDPVALAGLRMASSIHRSL